MWIEKGYSTQTALISMLEKWKLFMNKKGFVVRFNGFR